MTFKMETDRLILRSARMDDLEAVHAAKAAMWHDLQLWMSWSYADQESIDATRARIEKFGAHTGSLEIILGFEKATGDFVVSTGVNNRDEKDEYSTGYWVAKDKQGKGYATEATAAVIRYIFGELNAKAVHIDHYEGNGASERVIRKLGFDATCIDAKAKARCLDGHLLDIHRYVMRDVARLEAR